MYECALLDHARRRMKIFKVKLVKPNYTRRVPPPASKTTSVEISFLIFLVDVFLVHRKIGRFAIVSDLLLSFSLVKKVLSSKFPFTRILTFRSIKHSQTQTCIRLPRVLLDWIAGLLNLDCNPILWIGL